MSLPRSILTRAIATVACLLALVTYSAFAPATSAEVAPLLGCDCNCFYAGQKYSEGATRGGQTCACIHFDDGCNCSWQ